MSEILERLELRTHRATWSDGLLDLLCGVALIGIGVAWLAGRIVFGAITPALLVPLWKPLRARLTEPRLGTVELAEPRQRRNRRFMRLMLVAGVASCLLGVGAYLVHGQGLLPPLMLVKAMPAALVAMMGIAFAEAFQLPRFFVYGGAALLGAGVVAGVDALDPGWALLLTGVSALVGGTILAVRFVRRYPVAVDRRDA